MLKDSFPTAALTDQDIDPKVALANIAGEKDVEHFAAMVLRDDGTITFHSSMADQAQVNLWLDMFKDGIINGF